MNRRILKILTIVIYILFITSIISNTYATISSNFNGNLNGANVTPIQEILKAVLTVIRVVGVFIAVGILMILACKYIIASAGDRADIKKYAISYIIGAVILFATSGIAGILQKVIEGAFGTSA